MLILLADVAGRASVLDADTLEIAGERIRIWAVDAPSGQAWSAPAMWLGDVMGDSAAPFAEFPLTSSELRQLLAGPITVQSGSRTLTYPAPALALAEQFSTACDSFEAQRTLESVTPTVEIVEPGEP